MGCCGPPPSPLTATAPPVPPAACIPPSPFHLPVPPSLAPVAAAVPVGAGPKEDEATAVARSWRSAFSQMDGQILDESRQKGWLDGTTALASLQLNNTLYVANAGACALLGGRMAPMAMLRERGRREGGQ